jgi:hypothetical protein
VQALGFIDIMGGTCLKSPNIFFFFIFRVLGLEGFHPLFTCQLITQLSEEICNLSKLVISIQYQLKKKRKEKKMLAFVKVKSSLEGWTFWRYTYQLMWRTLKMYFAL